MSKLRVLRQRAAAPGRNAGAIPRDLAGYGLSSERRGQLELGHHEGHLFDTVFGKEVYLGRGQGLCVRVGEPGCVRERRGRVCRPRHSL